MHVAEPFKKANRMFHPEPTTVQVGDVVIGGNQIQVIAGPCSVESEAQITGIAKQVKEMGAHLLRGGAFKPRTSPYACLLYTSSPRRAARSGPAACSM